MVCHRLSDSAHYQCAIRWTLPQLLYQSGCGDAMELHIIDRHIHYIRCNIIVSEREKMKQCPFLSTKLNTREVHHDVIDLAAAAEVSIQGNSELLLFLPLKFYGMIRFLYENFPGENILG